MMQTIEGKRVYVVEFATMPDLPITGLTEEEMRYEALLSRIPGPVMRLPLASLAMKPRSTYAVALTQAIETGVITEPGKYAIHIDRKTDAWSVFKINED